MTDTAPLRPGDEIAYTVTYLEMPARPTAPLPPRPINQNVALIGATEPPVAFGAGTAGLYENEEVSLQTAADVEPILNYFKGNPPTRVKLTGAAVDCDETPTLTPRPPSFC